MVKDAKRSASRENTDILVPSYWQESRRPLTILIFLLPLIGLYEIGLAVVMRQAEGSGSGALTNLAHATLLRFFEVVGIMWTNGLYLGGLVIILVLALWHLINRDSWRLKPVFLVWMGVESVVLTLPLLVLAGLMGGGLDWGHESPLMSLSGNAVLGQMGLWSKILVSVGAGLYEELAFRMILLAVFHTLLVDMVGFTNRTGTVIAVMISAAAFTIYHPWGAGMDGTGSISPPKIVFFFLAGLYFGLIYVWRGFGIVVAVHTLYDVVTISLLMDPSTAS